MNALSMIGGDHGKGKAHKVINRLFGELMTPELLSMYTWSGRAKGNLRKNAFDSYNNIHKLIFSVLNLVENKYSMSDCVDDMKKRVFKYAYLKTNKNHENPIAIDGTDYASQIANINTFVVES